jgi:Ankyrin repeats (3 copies)
VLGGLDQCDESIQWFLAYIGDCMGRTENCFKFVITTTAGRDEHITSLLSAFPMDTYKPIRVESNTFLSTAAPVETALQVLVHKVSSYAPREVRIGELLSRCSSDPCLWRMVSQWLGSTKNLSRNKVEELVNVAAPSPEVVFAAILESVPTEQQRWADVLISWCTFCVRPLRVEELCVVSHMASRRVGRDGDVPMHVSTRLGLAEIQGQLGGMFTVRRDEIHFGHPALRRWLESRAEEPWSSVEWYRGKTIGQRHLDILQSCVEYLGLFEAESLADENQSYQLPYAIKHWPDHYQQVLKRDGVPASIEQGMSSILGQQPALHRLVRAYNGLSNPLIRIDEGFKSRVPVAAHFGLDGWIGDFGEDVQELSLAFVEASRCGHATLIRRLFEESPYTVDLKHISAQQAMEGASFFGHHCVIQEILRHLPEKLDVSYPWLDLVLCRASHLGWEGAVERLLGMGVPVNPPNPPTGMSPLHHAARFDQAAVAKILLKAGADLTSYSESGTMTPLHRSSSWGAVEITKLLLDGGGRRGGAGS